MGRAVLTEYLLKLATDPNALEKHRLGTRAQQEALMDKAKLARKHKTAIRSGDKNKILAEVQAELAATASIEPGSGTPVTFEMACCVGTGFMAAVRTAKKSKAKKR